MNIEEAIKSSNSMREASLKLEMPFSTFKRKAKALGIYEPNQGAKGNSKASYDMFVQNSTASNHTIKKRIVDDGLVDYKCNSCSIDEWQGQKIILELDHINGNNRDNRLTNLRLLCPNCHAQTSTYRGRNINSGVKKVSDADINKSYKANKGNIRQTLIEVGLSPKGGNYDRVKKIMRA